jgi:hypothetical protein
VNSSPQDRFKEIFSRDKEGVLMILVRRGNVCVVPLEGLNFSKCCYPFKFLKISELA